MHSVIRRWAAGTVIGIVAVALGGCGSPTAVDPVETGDSSACVGWTKPKDSKRITTSEFSFVLPKTWKKMSAAEANDDDLVAAYQNRGGSGLSAGESVSIYRTTGAINMTVKQFELVFISEFKNGNTSGSKFKNPVVQEPITVGGIKAARVSAKGKVGNVSYTMTMLGFSDRKYGYEIGIGSAIGSRTGKPEFVKNLACSWKWAD